MKLLISIVCFCLSTSIYGQTDTIFIKGGQQIFCNNIKEKKEQYQFTFLIAENTKAKSYVLKYLVDSIKHFNTIADSSVAKTKQVDSVQTVNTETTTPKEKSWKFTASIGVTLGSIVEINSTVGPDKKTFSLNLSTDLGINYRKEGKKFEMTNELHYLFGVQKEGLANGTHLQKVQDGLSTLHDLSRRFGKTSKWNFNAIIRANTSLLPIYDGDYFKDFTSLGRTQGFASPYDITVSPGIKYEANQYFRISISPYSFNMYGVKNNEIRNKGIFITELDGSGNYKSFLFKRLGAEINFWYDRQIKTWLDMQYRLGVSANYFEKITKSGLINGLFITRIKLIKDLYITHRAELKGDFSMHPFKPYYGQSILLSYARSF